MGRRMQHGLLTAALAVALALAAGVRLPAQEVVDRIAARVENDVILESELRALGRYQILVNGKAESDAQILDRLIDQWVVRTEADASHFPRPSDAEVQREVERLVKSFASPEEYEARKKQTGLSDSEIRGIVTAQLYLRGYLDSRFRAAVQVDAKAIEEFYQKAVVPRAQAHGQAPPSLEAASETIQEALVQQGIDEQADRWLKESRARLHVDKLIDEGAK
jgi:hypothetical protein